MSTKSFNAILSRLQIPKGFEQLLCHYSLPSRHTKEDGARRDTRYNLPVRLPVSCTDTNLGNVTGTAGSRHMIPHDDLHLAVVGVDLLGSTIMVFLRHDTKHQTVSALVVNFMDGRWGQLAQTPQELMERALRIDGTNNNEGHVRAIALDTVVRWWQKSIESIDKQLRVHVSGLMLHGIGCSTG